MKLTHTEIAPSGAPVINLRIGKDEVLILRGLVANARLHTPRTPDTETTCQRLGAMGRTLNSAEMSAFLETIES